MKKILAALAAVAFVLVSAPSFAGEPYWANWTKTIRLDMFPTCGVNVLGAGGDDVLQETVDIYCGVKPGGYQGYINPKVKALYDKGASKYPDGKLGVLEFKQIGAAFTTEIKNGKPVYDVVKIEDGSSIASKDKGHPLNPEVCANCHHNSQKGVCRKHGYVCGNRMN